MEPRKGRKELEGGGCGWGLCPGHVHGAHARGPEAWGASPAVQAGVCGPPCRPVLNSLLVWVQLSPRLGVTYWEQGTQGTGSPRDPLLSPAFLGSLLRKEGWTAALVGMPPEAEGQLGTAGGAAPRGEAEAKKQGPQEPPAPLQGGFS